MSGRNIRVVPPLLGEAPRREEPAPRLAAPQGPRPTVAHIASDEEDAPRIGAVLDALARTGAFRQVVLSPAGDEIAEFGAAEAVVRLSGDRDPIATLHERLTGAGADVVVIHGHDAIALAGAVVAARRRLPVVRVGRACGRRELGRLVDRLADVVLVYDEQDARTIEGARVPGERIRVVGNPLIDAVRGSLRSAVAHDVHTLERLKPRAYVLAILTGGSVAAAVDDALAAIAAKAPLVVIGATPEQPITAARAAGARLIERPGFARRLALIRSAGAVLTNSERALSEAAAIGVRCHTIGLERVRLHALTAIELGDDVAAIAALRPRVDAPAPCAVPLWDGRAGARIAEVMLANFARVRMLV